MVNTLLSGNGCLFGMVFRFWLVDGGIVCRFFKLRCSLWFFIYSFSLNCFQ